MPETADRIEAIRKEWGQRLLILGHHYQRSSVLAHADEKGDSLELARKAAANPVAERIVFCGVHFMAESADILTAPLQQVYMPDPGAGCPMANMATADQMESMWQVLKQHGDDWLPVVYVNSTAAIKALCGRWGGSACTSSNAAAVFKWAFDQGKRVFFLPDEHLGVNTARDLGVPDELVGVCNPREVNGGLSAEELKTARVVAWKGFCLVHQAFAVDQVAAVRARHPEARIIVHPESPKAVVDAADAHGSTAQIIRYVEDAPDGSTIVVGTELNLVQRLAEEQRGRVTVKALTPSVCANMAKTSPEALLELLEKWPAQHRIQVAAATATEAKRCLKTMLSL